jgi:E3 ubiquitin-protein ligase MYCBP2
VRQIRVLGKIEGESLKVGKQYSATTIQQRNCEAETLRVFRLITSQVFGKLLQGEEGQNLNDSGSISATESLEPLEESNDLREHMVGILFSRSKLTHLQKQVGRDIFINRGTSLTVFEGDSPHSTSNTKRD